MGRTGRLRKKKKQASTSKNLDHDLALINLRKCMTSQGWIDSKTLRLYDFRFTGRGVASTKNTLSGDVLISIPYPLLVTFTTIQTQGFLNFIVDKKKLYIHDFLTLFLIVEKHKLHLNEKTSIWTNYILTLPQKAPPMPWKIPYQWTNRFGTILEKAKILLEQSWIRITNSIKSETILECCGVNLRQILDYEIFFWAYAMVNTRAIYVDPKTVRNECKLGFESLLNEPEMALCPFLDMFNHDCGARTEAALVRRKDKLFYELTTLTDIQRYHQIFICYGSHDNEKLIIEYGFFIPDNGHDCVRFQGEEVIQALNIGLNRLQYKFIQDHNLNLDLYIDEGGPSFNLKAFLYVAHDTTSWNNSSVIYSNRYPENFNEKLLAVCKTLVELKVDEVENEVKMIDESKEGNSSEAESMIHDYLKYKKIFVNKIASLILKLK